MNVMLYDDKQGHDARLDSVEFDAEKRMASVHLLAYPETDAPQRVPITILFEGVLSLALNADLTSLANNRSAGNVNHWHMAEGGGTSHIYLIEGHIAISSQSAPQLVLR
ncbi:hypothetical protein [Rhizorhabdus argentea]|uniref:hypothetical protein n=1 Tax=Rhizorhabdus argentea TaxID=1387174 RepID=UPI0030EEB46C